MSSEDTLTLPMPRLGETMEEGTIAEWLVQPGQSFKRGEPLLEVETDKTLVEYPALGDGTLIEALVDPGDVIEVGTPIAVIQTTDIWDGIETLTADAKVEPADGSAVDDAYLVQASPNSRETVDQPLRATPLARRIAKQNGIDLEAVVGSGRRGRIEADDVRGVFLAGSGARNSSAPGTQYKVFFVHGFAGSGANWAALRARLHRSGFQTVAPDMPGHGANGSEASGVLSLIDWLDEVLSDQGEPVHLIGHSLGAYVAAHAAAERTGKVSRLTLIAPIGCGLEINGNFIHGMAQKPGPGKVAHLMRLLGSKATNLDDQAQTSIAEELQKVQLTSLAEEMAQGHTQELDIVAALNALAQRLPVSAVFGIRDQIVPRDHVFNMPSHVACHVVEAGHMPQWDAVEEMARIIAAK